MYQIQIAKPWVFGVHLVLTEGECQGESGSVGKRKSILTF